MLSTTAKQKLIKSHSTHEEDTGSAEVQIALFTEKINHSYNSIENCITKVLESS